MGVQIKRCAKCGAEHDDAYDGCPQCAERGKAVAMNNGLIGCAQAMIGIGLLVFLLFSCSR